MINPGLPATNPGLPGTSPGPPGKDLKAGLISQETHTRKSLITGIRDIEKNSAVFVLIKSLR